MESTDEQTGTGIDDLSIPKAIVTRILKGSTVFNLAMQKEAKDAFTKAIELAKKAGRKTISANDVYEALNSSEFEQFVAAIKHDTEAFNQNAKEKRAAQTRSNRAIKKAKMTPNIENSVADDAAPNKETDI